MRARHLGASISLGSLENWGNVSRAFRPTFQHFGNVSRAFRPAFRLSLDSLENWGCVPGVPPIGDWERFLGVPPIVPSSRLSLGLLDDECFQGASDASLDVVHRWGAEARSGIFGDFHEIP